MSIFDTTSGQSPLHGVPNTFSVDGSTNARFGFISNRRSTQSRWRRTTRIAFDYPLGTWLALDLVIGIFALVTSHALSPAFRSELSHAYSIPVAAAVFSVLLIIANYTLGLYDRHNFAVAGRIALLGTLANIIALSILTVIYSWIPFIRIGRIVLAATFVLSTGGLIACRLTVRSLVRRSKIRVMFVGRSEHFHPLAHELQQQFSDFYDSPSYVDFSAMASHKRNEELAAALVRHRPEDIVIEEEESILSELFSQSASILSAGISIRSYRTYFEQLLGRLPVEILDNRNILGNDFVLGNGPGRTLKRVQDILLASLGLSIGSPIFILAAIMVKSTSRGPVIYSQMRVGLYGSHFRIYKFRTMRTDAEKDGGAVWAKVGDIRATRVGTFLRRTRLDELPQLWNILRGDMSFVGPRPERPEFVDKLRHDIRHYDLRHLVLPGLTGWAQIRYRYSSSSDEAKKKLAFDLYYVQHRGATFDLAICARTLAAMAKGAR